MDKKLTSEKALADVFRTWFRECAIVWVDVMEARPSRGTSRRFQPISAELGKAELSHAGQRLTETVLDNPRATLPK